jgi:pentatricopeptide repeat protein
LPTLLPLVSNDVDFRRQLAFLSQPGLVVEFTDACGRAGKVSHALQLFDDMKAEGLVPDRIAFNAMFLALRMAKDPDKVRRRRFASELANFLCFSYCCYWLCFALQTIELWNEMCQSSSTKPRPVKSMDPRGRDNTSPDIITISECMSTLSEAGRVQQMDQVFEAALYRGIVLRSNALDVQWEVDLSGMAFPVARAACRYLLRNVVAKGSKPNEVQDMTFITGVGKAQQNRKEAYPFDNGFGSCDNVLDKKDPTTSLRDFVQGILATDFEPALVSTIPERAKGTVVIEKNILAEWLEHQKS